LINIYKLILMTDNIIFQLSEKTRRILAPFKAFIKRRASGHLPYDYLVPAGPYQEQWDWDAFFMGVALSAEVSSESIYLRNWTLNFISNAKPDGKVAGCCKSNV